MKKMLSTVLVMCLSIFAFAQLQKKDTAVLLKLPADPVTVARFKEKLVELALQNPDISQYAIKKEINKYEKNMAGSAWLSHFTAAGNLNEFTIKGNSNNNVNANYYPRYNFGVMLPLGNLIKIPNDVKRVKAEGRLLDKQREAESIALKGKVLEAYEEYAANKKLFELHMPLMEDALQNFNQTEEKFRAGDPAVPLEIYKSTYSAYNGEMVKHIQLEKVLRQSKLILEALVGTTLENVMAQL
ncbi:TolC family protein [Chitinophaga oryzae]|uniref:TolC family protein n=1 Tax=Chitinophaga oryzae TaxID=2725414 RepID=A0AAE6ZFE1_9BACT|nr:TolC family protein [Chitinophaga oryzae]QJB31045.1 TolC family protein [Chitinophaga oryzae]QJB37530.1 TolC family protein [Chitinophaga oryzae]